MSFHRQKKIGRTILNIYWWKSKYSRSCTCGGMNVSIYGSTSWYTTWGRKWCEMKTASSNFFQPAMIYRLYSFAFAYLDSSQRVGVALHDRLFDTHATSLSFRFALDSSSSGFLFASISLILSYLSNVIEGTKKELIRSLAEIQNNPEEVQQNCLLPCQFSIISICWLVTTGVTWAWQER